MKTKTNGTQIHEKLNACCYLMNYERTDHSLIFAQKITSPSAVFPSKVVYVELGRKEGMSLVKASVEVPAESGQAC